MEFAAKGLPLRELAGGGGLEKVNPVRGMCGGVPSEGAEAGREVREKAGLGRPVQQPEVVDHSSQHKGEASQQGLMGSLQVLVLVFHQIPVELLGQVRGA